MIKKIEIEGYRSIDKVCVELAPVTVLIGKSGSGKSNFCHALCFLRDLTSNNISNVIKQEGGWTRILPAWGKGSLCRLGIVFSLEDGDDYCYTVCFKPHPNDPKNMILSEETMKFGNKTLYSRDTGKWLVPPGMVNPPKLHHDTLAIGILPAITEVVYAYSALNTGIGYHNFRSDVLSISKDSKSAAFKGGLDDSAANFRNVLVELNRDIKLRKSKERIMKCLKAVNDSIQSIEPDNIQNPDKVIVAHKAGNLVIDMDLSNESDGLRRFYAQLLALYQTPSKMILIFEEPENAIYPAALEILAREFNLAAKEGRGQVILTTHNPCLLDYLESESIRVVDRDGLATKIGMLVPEQIEALKAKDLFPGELLTVDPARRMAVGE